MSQGSMDRMDRTIHKYSFTTRRDLLALILPYANVTCRSYPQVDKPGEVEVNII